MVQMAFTLLRSVESPISRTERAGRGADREDGVDVVNQRAAPCGRSPHGHAATFLEGYKVARHFCLQTIVRTTKSCGSVYQEALACIDRASNVALSSATRCVMRSLSLCSTSANT